MQSTKISHLEINLLYVVKAPPWVCVENTAQKGLPKTKDRTPHNNQVYDLSWDIPRSAEFFVHTSFGSA